MKISVLNPNSSRDVSASMERSLSLIAKETWPVIDVATLDAAPKGIETDEDIAFVSPLVAEFVRSTEAQAFVIGCFSDPGVPKAREAVAEPVIGIGEAAYRAASKKGRRFGVVSLGPASVDRHRQAIDRFGLTDLLVDDRPVNMSVADAHASDKALQAIAEVSDGLIEDGAEAIVLACAGMGNHCPVLEKMTGLPVIDPVHAGVIAAVKALKNGHR